ncbi:hypothetical protein IE81DRAFT_322914 [Ceraceosorus guamensis]|uniref:Uncharacterized protein n=1 Tax=Ceraceosorus guamensis TaxID=1522189 RepID=A0A316W324_9BASI|nr:hypothetical protein IE81DRAFT_322914 [Ceraceosorus guamensis]PWN42991.1 hypothetical protein IE81DRAFT_322914 [Ceraceosorus guamensis]
MSSIPATFRGLRAASRTLSTSCASHRSLSTSTAHHSQTPSDASATNINNPSEREAYRLEAQAAEEKKRLKRWKRRAQLTKDQKLRKAIDLYHLSESFFPNPKSKVESPSSVEGQVGGQGQSEAGSATRPSAPKYSGSSRQLSEHEEELDSRIRKDMLSPLTRSVNQGGRTSDLLFKTSLALLTEREARRTKAGSGFDPHVDPDMDYESWNGTSSSSSGGQSKSVFGDGSFGNSSEALASLDAVLGRSSRSSTTDTSVSAQVEGSPTAIAAFSNQAEIQERSKWLSSGVNLNFDAEELSERDLRVRDALFGTVRGSKPGLEVIRQRIRRRKQMMEDGGGLEGQGTS